MTDNVTRAHRNVYAALAAAQAEMGAALKDSVNPAFKSKYADLAAVIEAVRPALTRHGITFFQPLVQDEFGRGVKTILAHGESDTLVECTVPVIVGKNDMQGLGSAITYARRYGLMGMAGIAADDDDGNAAAASVKGNTNPTTEALGDAWRDGILDSLPENATPQQKAKAFADAICEGFRSKKSLKGLENEWSRRAKIIESLSGRFSDLHGEVVEAYEIARNDLIPATAAE